MLGLWCAGLLLTPGPAAEPPPPAAPIPEDSAGFTLSDLLPRAFQKNPRLHMTVITEYTAAGRKIPPATPAHPAYYAAGDAGYHVEGESYAGEDMPAPAGLKTAVEKALATNGYLPAAASGHPPALFISYYWGAANLPDPDFPDIGHHHLLVRAALIGGVKFAEEFHQALAEEDALRELGGSPPAFSPVHQFEERDERTRALVQQARGDTYFLIAAAYDYQSIARGKRTLLWRTKMTVDAQGVSLAQTLPPLIASSGPFLGRDMPEPELLIRRVLHNGRVEAGAPTVVGYGAAPAPANSGKTSP